MTNKIYFVIIMTLALVVLVLSVGLAYERGHNNGYDEGWNDGTAYAESWGWQSCMGWQSCIEENNLYDRYEASHEI